MRISVALCTYNGERFLQEQLDSLRRQTRPPDELVIVDDASHDASVEVARRFADSTRLPVRLAVNPRNLGYAANFERAISRCTGDVVALCDQDDVWRDDKLERIADVFATCDNIGMVFSDALLVDAAGRPLPGRLWERVGFAAHERMRAEAGDLFRLLLRGTLVTGATMAFRARLRQFVLPICPGWDHDAWIALLLSAVSEVRAIAEPLIRYRQHDDNQIGARQVGMVERWQRMRRLGSTPQAERQRRYALALDRLRALTAVPPETTALLTAALEHVSARACLPPTRRARLTPVLRELLRGRYALASFGVRSAVRDLLM